MMLTTDMALTTDKSFKKYAKLYADSEEKFFSDYSAAYAKFVLFSLFHYRVLTFYVKTSRARSSSRSILPSHSIRSSRRSSQGRRLNLEEYIDSISNYRCIRNSIDSNRVSVTLSSE